MRIVTYKCDRCGRESKKEADIKRLTLSFPYSLEAPYVEALERDFCGGCIEDILQYAGKQKEEPEQMKPEPIEEEKEPHGDDVMGAMCKLIGNGCRYIEHVMPKRLYSEFGHSNTVDREGRCVSMLIDEEGALKENKLINTLASHLYETDKHGCPIYGNVLFVADVYEDDGFSFAGIEPETFNVLHAQLEELAPKIIKALLFMLSVKRR